MAKKPKDKPQEAEAAADGAPAPGGLKGLLANKRLLLMVGGGLVVLLGGAGGAAWTLGLFTKAQPAAEQTAQAQEAARPRVPHFMDLPEMTVNLSTGAQRPQYLRIKIALELADPAIATQLQPMMPRVQDTVQTFLREVRPGDMEGSGGVLRLKEEITRRVNLVAAPARVDAVLFREILVQ